MEPEEVTDRQEDGSLQERVIFLLLLGYSQSWAPEPCWRLERFGPARVPAGSFVAWATARILVPPWLIGGLDLPHTVC